MCFTLYLLYSKIGFSSMSNAVKYEAKLIEKYIKDSLNENYYIPGQGFHTHNKVTVKDKNGNTSMVSIDDPRYLSRELVHIQTGRKHTKESKLKISKSKVGKGNGWDGRSHTNETKLKISKSTKGRVGTRNGVKLSDETKLKMSKAKLLRIEFVRLFSRHRKTLRNWKANQIGTML